MDTVTITIQPPTGDMYYPDLSGYGGFSNQFTPKVISGLETLSQMSNAEITHNRPTCKECKCISTFAKVR